MTMDTYTLVVRETPTHDGIDADVLGEDGLVEETTQVAYEDYDLMAERENGGPVPIETEFTVDTQTLELQLHRDERTFRFHVIADDEQVAEATVTDTDWNLVHTE
ncbi:MAG: hypothetical protein ABEH90_00845 [Halolamina sp.]